MKYTYSVSNLRNEVYVLHNNDKLLFSIQGNEINIDLTKMSNEELDIFISNNYLDVINDLIN
jgi:hypothetical protein